MEKGTRVLFIPYSTGVYVPFSLHQYSPKEIESIMKLGHVDLEEEVFNQVEKSLRMTFYLDLECLSQSYQEILRYFFSSF